MSSISSSNTNSLNTLYSFIARKKKYYKNKAKIIKKSNDIQFLMDLTLSTVSQTPKLSINRQYTNTLQLRNSVDSPKLKETFERVTAQNDYLKITNRLNKLDKIEKLMKKEIELAHEKTKEVFRMQQQNYLHAKNKTLYKEQMANLIENKRKSFSLSREQRKAKKQASFTALLLQKKTKADMLRQLEKNWENNYYEQKRNITNKNLEFAKKIKNINNKHKELRSISQASKRNSINLAYNYSIEKQKEISFNFRKKIAKLAEIEISVIENLSNTINVRNNHLNDLNSLMTVSKIPVSQRYNCVNIEM